MISDIREYLHNNEEFKINQAYIRIKYIFHCFVINIQEEINFNSNEYCKYNKTVIKAYIKYYNTYWKHYNK